MTKAPGDHNSPHKELCACNLILLFKTLLILGNTQSNTGKFALVWIFREIQEITSNSFRVQQQSLNIREMNLQFEIIEYYA